MTTRRKVWLGTLLAATLVLGGQAWAAQELGSGGNGASGNPITSDSSTTADLTSTSDTQVNATSTANSITASTTTPVTYTVNGTHTLSTNAQTLTVEGFDSTGLATLKMNGGSLTVDGALALNGYGVLDASAAGAGAITNTGTITFGTGSTYTAHASNKVIDNAGGTIQIAVDHTDLADLLGNLVVADAGTVEMSGAIGSSGFAASGFTDGIFTFTAAQTTTTTETVNVGSTATVQFAGGGNIGGAVTAGKIITGATGNLGNTSTILGAALTSDLEVNDNTTLSATFTGQNATINATGKITLNSANMEISATKTLDNKGELNLAGNNLTFATGGFYKGTGTEKINNSGGVGTVTFDGNITDGSAAADKSIFTALVTGNADIGKVVVNGAFGSTSGTMGSSSITAGTVTLDGGSAAANYSPVDLVFGSGTVGSMVGADVLLTGAGANTVGTVTAKSVTLDAAAVDTNTFTGAITTNLLELKAGATIDATATVSAGELKIATSTTTINNATAGIDMTGKTFNNAGTVTNNTKLVFGKDSTITSVGTINSDGSVEIDTQAGVTVMKNLLAGTNLTNTGSADIKATNASALVIADSLALATAVAGTKVNIDNSSAGTLVFSGAAFDAKSADLNLKSGAIEFSNAAATITATMVTIDGADVVFSGAAATITGNATVTTGTATFNNAANVSGTFAANGGTTTFDGTTIIGAGSAVSANAIVNINAGFTSTSAANQIQGTVYAGAGSTIALDAVTLAGGATLSIAKGADVTFSGTTTAAADTITVTGIWAVNDVAITGGGFATTDTFTAGRYTLAGNGTDLIVNAANAAYTAETLGPLVAAMGESSVNMIRGYGLMDGIAVDPASDPALVAAIDAETAVIEGLLLSANGADRASGLLRQRQRQGEYGNAAREALAVTTENFWKRLNGRMNYNLDFNFGLNTVAAAPAFENGYASIRSRAGGYDYCAPATTIWADFHGGWAKQKEKANINGYKYDGYGVTLGAERRAGRFVFGFAGAYTRANVDVDDLRTDFDADVMNLGLYAAYQHESGLFANAGVGYAYAWNDYDVKAAAPKKGDFENQAYTANLDLGYVFRTPAVNIIPSVGVHYTHIRQDGWRESGGVLGTTGFFRKERYNAVDVPVALRINKVIEAGCVTFAPEVRAAWVYAAKKNRSEIDYGLRGSNLTTTMYGVNPGRNRAIVGVGVKAKWRNNVEAGLDYDYEWRSKYYNHNLSANIGVSF